MKTLKGVWGGLLPALRLSVEVLPRVGAVPAATMAAALSLLGSAVLFGSGPETGPRFTMAMPHLDGPDRHALITPPPGKTAAREAVVPAFQPKASPEGLINVPAMPGAAGLPPPSFAALPPLAAVPPLAPAPRPDLIAETPKGGLPVIAADGRSPAYVYARPFVIDERPLVAVVVTGLGLDPEATNAAIARLPPEVSLAFSPYAAGLDGWIKAARDAGHEVLLTLPMEPLLFPTHDEGPLALTANLTAAAAVERLESILAKAGGYVGVAGPQRSPFAATEPMPAILSALRARGLIYVGGPLPTKGMSERRTALVTAAIDAQPFRGAVDAQLDRIAAHAQTKGSAVALASPLPVSFERLAAWLPGLAANGLALAPVSAVAAAGRDR